MVHNRVFVPFLGLVLLWSLAQTAITPDTQISSRCGLDHARSKLGLGSLDPEHLKRDMERQSTQSRRDPANPIYIPVHYHIIYNAEGEGNLDDLTIYYQTYVLNGAFNPHGYYFWTKSIERVSESEWTDDCDTHAAAIGAAYATEPERSMNVYTCVHAGFTDDGGITLGFTYLPEDHVATDTNNGVWVGYYTLPNAGNGFYSRGDTLVHEAGHYIGLLHTFEGECDPTNDGVIDTPACKANTGISCPDDRDTCPGGGVDDVRNYMDYSIDSCMNHFTPGQEARIDYQVATYKPLFATNAAASDPQMNFPPFNPDPNASNRFGNWLHAIRALW